MCCGKMGYKINILEAAFSRLRGMGDTMVEEKKKKKEGPIPPAPSRSLSSPTALPVRTGARGAQMHLQWNQCQRKRPGLR